MRGDPGLIDDALCKRMNGPFCTCLPQRVNDLRLAAAQVGVTYR
jgi:hypothetical protein